MFSPGNAGSSSVIRLNGNLSGGTKKQGIPSSVGRQAGISYNRSYGNDRNVIFNINQLGGVGKGKSMFSPSSDGVQHKDITPTDSNLIVRTTNLVGKVVINEENTRTGKSMYFSGDLINLQGQSMGNLIGRLTTTDLAYTSETEEDQYRELVFNLPDGQIIMLGLAKYVVTTDVTATYINNNETGVIVGGTGKYIGLRGTVNSTKIMAGIWEYTFNFTNNNVKPTDFIIETTNGAQVTIGLSGETLGESSIGDVTYFSYDTVNDTGTVVGQSTIMIDNATATVFSEIVFILPNGKIFVLLSAEYDNTDSTGLTGVIVGGTGHYIGVRGTVTTSNTHLSDSGEKYAFNFVNRSSVAAGTLVIEQDISNLTVTNINNTGATYFFDAVLRNEDKTFILGNLAGLATTVDVTLEDTTQDQDRYREIAYNMNDGQLMVLSAAIYSPSTSVNSADFSNSVAPGIIVGGTGKYTGARGSHTTKKKSDGTFTHTFHFIG